MKNEILDLKQRVYQLTSDFSGALTSALIALGHAAAHGRDAGARVRECRAVGRDYEKALDRLLDALREGETTRDRWSAPSASAGC